MPTRVIGVPITAKWFHRQEIGTVSNSGSWIHSAKLEMRSLKHFASPDAKVRFVLVATVITFEAHKSNPNVCIERQKKMILEFDPKGLRFLWHGKPIEFINGSHFAKQTKKKFAAIARGSNA